MPQFAFRVASFIGRFAVPFSLLAQIALIIPLCTSLTSDRRERPLDRSRLKRMTKLLP